VARTPKLADSEITRRLNEIFDAELELGKLDPVLEQLQLEVLQRERWPDAPARSRRQRAKSPPGRGGRRGA
jgi:hypothetical protein